MHQRAGSGGTFVTAQQAHNMKIEVDVATCHGRCLRNNRARTTTPLNLALAGRKQLQ